jgi:hypothetical protein
LSGSKLLNFAHDLGARSVSSFASNRRSPTTILTLVTWGS